MFLLANKFSDKNTWLTSQPHTEAFHIVMGKNRKKILLFSCFDKKKCNWIYLFYSPKGDVFAFIDIIAYTKINLHTQGQLSITQRITCLVYAVYAKKTNKKIISTIMFSIIKNPIYREAIKSLKLAKNRTIIIIFRLLFLHLY